MTKYDKKTYHKYVSSYKIEALIELLLLHHSQYLVHAQDRNFQRNYDTLTDLLEQWRWVEQNVTLNIVPELNPIQEQERIKNTVFDFINHLPEYYFDVLNGKRLPPPIQKPYYITYLRSIKWIGQ